MLEFSIYPDLTDKLLDEEANLYDMEYDTETPDTSKKFLDFWTTRAAALFRIRPDEVLLPL
jgi:hypothetical protein